MATPDDVTADKAAVAAAQAALAANDAVEADLIHRLVSAQQVETDANQAYATALSKLILDEEALVTPPVVPPVTVPPVVAPPALTAYPKRGVYVGAQGSQATYVEGQTVPGFGKIINGLLTLPGGNVELPANTTIKAAIVSPGGGVVKARNVREEGGYGHESYWRILGGGGSFDLENCSAVRTGNTGLGSSVSHGFFAPPTPAGAPVHRLVSSRAEGTQTGYALGGGPDAAHRRELIGCVAVELRQVGTGHCESEFLGVVGGGFFHTQFCHWEPSSRTGWQTAAAFMQPAPAPCDWLLEDTFLAGQNIDLYIESAYQATPQSWLPAAPPTGHPGILNATNVDFGPMTRPSASWFTWWKNGWGRFATFTNCREVDAAYVPTGFVLPMPPAGFVQGDSSYLRKPLTRVD